MRLILAAMLMATATPLLAAPPPPPPAFIAQAAEDLTSPQGLNSPALTPLLAEDVEVLLNGRRLASGKAQWLDLRAAHAFHDNGRILGLSEARDSLLILDSFDSVDRTNLPPNALFDARMVSRATLYGFGPDHLIHTVSLSQTDGFWIRKAF